MVRCLREDRTLLAVNDFIRKVEFIETAGGKLPAMGPRYVESVADSVDTVYKGKGRGRLNRVYKGEG